MRLQGTLQKHNAENSKQIFPGYTAKTQCRKFETNIPGKGTARLQSQFLHSWFCERFMYSSDRPAYSAVGKQVGRTWEYCIDHSQTHECGNWD